jgi:hypothetical protein
LYSVFDNSSFSNFSSLSIFTSESGNRFAGEHDKKERIIMQRKKSRDLEGMRELRKRLIFIFVEGTELVRLTET